MAHDLNIRNAGKDLIAALKSEAALVGKTLRDYCLEILESRDIQNKKAKMLRQTLPSGAVTCVELSDGATEPYLQTNEPGLTMGIERSEPVMVTACGADLSRPEVARAVTDVAEAAAKYIESSSPVVPASELPKPNTHRCPRCSSKLVPWGTKVWRCVKCARNYTAEELA